MDQTKRLLKALAPKPANLQGDTFQLPNLGGVNDFLNQGIKGPKELDFPEFKMSTGAVAGRVLTCDANGVGTWQEAPTSDGGTWALATAEVLDWGLKSNSEGNYEIETYTDNYDITDGQFELGNKYSDRFTFDDADGETWKWRAYDMWGCDGTAEITTNVIVLRGDADEITNRGLKDVKLENGYDVQVYIDMTGGISGEGMGFILQENEGGDDYAVIWIDNDGVGGWSWYYEVNDGVDNWGYDDGVLSQPNVGLRIERVANGGNYDRYNFYIDHTSNGTWTLLGTVDATGYDGDQSVVLQGYGYSGRSWSFPFNEFQINSGTLVNDGANPYRTSGNWTTELYKMPKDCKIGTVKFTLSGASANNYINRTQLLDRNDVVKIDNPTNITTDGEKSFDLSTLNIDYDFKIKIYLLGNGAGSCAVSNISITFEET